MNQLNLIQVEYEKLADILSKSIHDLSNPISITIGQMSILEMYHSRRQLSPEKIDNIIEKSKVANSRIREEITELRALCKIIQADELITSLDTLVRALNYFFKPRLETESIDFKVKLAANSEINENQNISETFIILKFICESIIEQQVNNTKKAFIELYYEEDIFQCHFQGVYLPAYVLDSDFITQAISNRKIELSPVDTTNLIQILQFKPIAKQNTLQNE